MMGLRREFIKMNDNDYGVYYLPAMELILPESSLGSRMAQILAFDRLLGVKLGEEFCQRSSIEDRPLPDDWRQFLMQLAGPYGKSLLKAYRIKHKLEKAEHQNVKQD